MMRTVLAAVRLQMAVLRRSPGDLTALVNAPLFTVIFLAVFRHAGREDLVGHAILAPVMIALFAMSLNVSGEILSKDRASGRLELQLAAPVPVSAVVLGRVCTVTCVSLVSILECSFVAWALFGVTVPIHHPLLFALTLVCTGLAMAGTAAAMSAVFVLARSTRTFQNSLSYPFYLLGGVLVPATLLPDWLAPVTRVVFLSWATDLMRESLRTADVQHVVARLAAILGIGAITHLAGAWVLGRALVRLRTSGTVGFG